MNGTESKARDQGPCRVKWLGFLPHSMAFGLRWQDEVYGIGTIVLQVSDFAIDKITVLPRHEVGQDDSLVADERRHVVQLIEGEYITEIAVRRNDRDEVWGIQFATNMRVHPWTGNASGYVERVAAARGWYISSLMAVPLPRYSEKLDAEGDMCELGCRFDRISSLYSANRGELSRDSKVRKSAEVNFRDPDAVDQPFFRAHRRLHALIITCSSGVVSLVTFAKEQYDRYLRLRDRPLGWNEHGLVLVDDDRITSVQVAHSNGSFAIRFHTARYSTCWYGRPVSRATDKIMEFTAREDESVCGFFGSLTAAGRICSLGVAFAKSPGAPQSDDDSADDFA